MKALDDGLLLLRKHVGHDLVDAADLASHRLGRAMVVAGHHDDAQSGAAQRGDRIYGAVLDRVSHDDQPRKLAVNPDEHHALSLGAKSIGVIFQGFRIDPQVGQQCLVAKRDRATFHRAGYAFAGMRGEVAGLGNIEAAIGCPRDDRGGKRMLAAFLERRRKPKHVRFVKARGGANLDQFGFAQRQRPRLVDYKRVDLLHQLKRFGIFDQHACAGAAAGADHDRHRRREAECAGASDDQHRNGVDERMAEARFRPDQRPGDEGRDRNQHDRRHEPARHLVGEFLDGRTRTLRLGHHAHDLRQHRILANPFGAHDEGAGAVDGRSGNLVAGYFLDRYRFAGDHRFIDRTMTIDHDPIDRHFLTRADAQQGTNLDLLQRHILF